MLVLELTKNTTSFCKNHAETHGKNYRDQQPGHLDNGEKNALITAQGTLSKLTPFKRVEAFQLKQLTFVCVVFVGQLFWDQLINHLHT